MRNKIGIYRAELYPFYSITQEFADFHVMLSDEEIDKLNQLNDDINKMQELIENRLKED